MDARCRDCGAELIQDRPGGLYVTADDRRNATCGDPPIYTILIDRPPRLHKPIVKVPAATTTPML